ncbi:rhomboid family intramembrane serine protease [Robertmurraya korlensis]|uniref:rhomboid family intramembrane serine protease n=1 Tax=Robertmurraya korlensis TaxID=519977 RepID=UPI000825FBBE|nr:rhomboid family intramembrane serine protease [Robertmurraya korlensis]
MDKLEDYLFWKLAHFLIHKKEYRLLRSSTSQQELWFEKVENKQVPIIRLRRVDLDWSNWLARDIENTGNNGDAIRRQFIRGEANVLNIYVSAYPPVDDYEFLLTEQKLLKTNLTTKVITRDSYNRVLSDLEQVFNEEVPFESKEEYSLDEIEVLKNATLEKAIERIKIEKSMFEYGKPFFTYVFIVFQIAAFLFLELKGGSTNTATLIKYGAKFNPLILEGEWWRFLTPILLHIGFIHLFMNTLALYYLGTTIERIYGRLRFLFIYLVAGFSGSLASFLFSTSLSAGASGAIFGCFGALLYFGLNYRSLFFRTMGFNVLVVIAINLSLGFTIPGIDNAGHLGGLVGGFLATAIVHFPKQKKWFRQALFLLLTVVGMGSLLWYGYTNPEEIIDTQSVMVLSQIYLQDENYDKAYDLLNNAVQTHQPDAELFFQLSYVEIKKNDLSSAEKHLQRAIELDKNFHEAFYNLSLIYYELGNREDSLKYVQKAAELAPSREEYQSLIDKLQE